MGNLIGVEEPACSDLGGKERQGVPVGRLSAARSLRASVVLPAPLGPASSNSRGIFTTGKWPGLEQPAALTVRLQCHQVALSDLHG